MNDSIEKALEAGETRALEDAIAASPDALVIDWRNDAATLVGDVAAIAARLGVTAVLDDRVDASTPATDALPIWNEALRPAAEMRLLRSTARDDTRVVLIRSAAWWREMTERHAALLEVTFQPLPIAIAGAKARKPRQGGGRDRVTPLLRFPAEWIGDPRLGSARRDQAVAGLEEALGCPKEVGRAVQSMRLLGTFHQIRGQALVLAEDLSGWQALRLGHGFASAAILLSDRLYLADRRPTKPPRTDEWQVGHAVALGLALGVGADDRTLAIFERRMRDGSLGESRGPYARYLLALGRLLDPREEPSTFAGDEMGPWRALFAAWDDDEAFAAALCLALEHHVEHAVPSSRHLGEFEGGPEQAFPTEIVAALRLRESRGLATPYIDHPLARTTLVETRPSGPWPVDDLLARARAHAETVDPPQPDSRPGSATSLRGRLGRALGRWFGGPR